MAVEAVISIHALVKRATNISAIAIADEKISIHALVKRATVDICNKLLQICNFNPRPREEGDHMETTTMQKSFYFNPRPREEGDRMEFNKADTRNNFNPRPREEGDYMAITSKAQNGISIHALVKRATYA